MLVATNVALPMLTEKSENVPNKLDGAANESPGQTAADATCFLPPPTVEFERAETSLRKRMFNVKKLDILGFTNSKLFLISSLLGWKTVLKLRNGFWAKINPRYWEVSRPKGETKNVTIKLFIKASEGFKKAPKVNRDLERRLYRFSPSDDRASKHQRGALPQQA